MPRQLVYASGSAPFFTAGDLDAILAVSRRRNASEGVTGVLLFHDGNFFQVLEGAPDAVEAALARIKRDRRHSRLVTLLDREIDLPVFPDWSMGFLGYSELASGAREAFLGLRRALQPSRVSGDTFHGDPELAALARAFLGSLQDLPSVR